MTCNYNKWQPIETAPKDGTAILVFVEGKYYGDTWCDVAHFNNIKQAWFSGNVAMKIPTHWQPLPLPPTENEMNVAPKEGE